MLATLASPVPRSFPLRRVPTFGRSNNRIRKTPSFVAYLPAAFAPPLHVSTTFAVPVPRRNNHSLLTSSLRSVHTRATSRQFTIMNGTSTAARPKRKADGSPNLAPPAKRATNGTLSDEEASDVEFVDYDDEADLAHDLHAQVGRPIGLPLRPCRCRCAIHDCKLSRGSSCMN